MDIKHRSLAGGFVQNDRVDGELAMSRAIGAIAPKRINYPRHRHASASAENTSQWAASLETDGRADDGRTTDDDCEDKTQQINGVLILKIYGLATAITTETTMFIWKRSSSLAVFSNDLSKVRSKSWVATPMWTILAQVFALSADT